MMRKKQSNVVAKIVGGIAIGAASLAGVVFVSALAQLYRERND